MVEHAELSAKSANKWKSGKGWLAFQSGNRANGSKVFDFHGPVVPCAVLEAENPRLKMAVRQNVGQSAVWARASALTYESFF